MFLKVDLPNSRSKLGSGEVIMSSRLFHCLSCTDDVRNMYFSFGYASFVV